MESGEEGEGWRGVSLGGVGDAPAAGPGQAAGAARPRRATGGDGVWRTAGASPAPDVGLRGPWCIALVGNVSL